MHFSIVTPEPFSPACFSTFTDPTPLQKKFKNLTPPFFDLEITEFLEFSTFEFKENFQTPHCVGFGLGVWALSGYAVFRLLHRLVALEHFRNFPFSKTLSALGWFG